MTDVANGRRLTGWIAIFAAAMMLATLMVSVSVTGNDNNLMLDPAKALALPSDKIAGFRLFLMADSFGYYLPFLVIGAYLWRRLRDIGGAMVDAALLCILAYVLLGIAGASIQWAVIAQLATSHASGDTAVKAATEVAWLTTVWGAQKGLWLMEGPTMGFWGIVTGLAMYAQGMKYGAFLTVIGVIYAALFLLFLTGLDAIGEGAVLVAVILMPIWVALLGIGLLRGAKL